MTAAANSPTLRTERPPPVAASCRGELCTHALGRNVAEQFQRPPLVCHCVRQEEFGMDSGGTARQPERQSSKQYSLFGDLRISTTLSIIMFFSPRLKKYTIVRFVMKPDFGQRPIKSMQFNRRLFLYCSLWECFFGPLGILVAIPLMTSSEWKKKLPFCHIWYRILIHLWFTRLLGF